MLFWVLDLHHGPASTYCCYCGYSSLSTPPNTWSCLDDVCLDGSARHLLLLSSSFLEPLGQCGEPWTFAWTKPARINTKDSPL